MSRRWTEMDNRVQRTDLLRLLRSYPILTVKIKNKTIFDGKHKSLKKRIPSLLAILIKKYTSYIYYLLVLGRNLNKKQIHRLCTVLSSEILEGEIAYL